MKREREQKSKYSWSNFAHYILILISETRYVNFRQVKISNIKSHEKKSKIMDHIVLKNQQKQQMIFEKAVHMFEFKCQSLSHFAASAVK